ncbi:MAG: outer membrane beta-barrel protein [Bacteroidota bacterium]
MKTRKKILFTAVILTICSIKSFGQIKDSTGKLTLSGYVDTYYASYSDSLAFGTYQKFASISPRNKTFGLNIALISAQYKADRVRGVVTLHYGDVVKSLWSPVFNNVMEANIGVSITKRLWIDAGLFRTHLGTEGLLPSENITSSLSVTTIYKPFYESGIRLSCDPNDKLSIKLFLLNGYNMFEDNNNRKSFGMLVNYALNKKGNIGYSNYIGDDTPDIADTISHSRSYHNVYWNYVFLGKLKIQVGVDFATQKNSDITNGTQTEIIYSGLLALKYQLKKKIAVYGKADTFYDSAGLLSGVIVDRTGKVTGLKLWGATFGMEYKPTDNIYFRIEGRQIQMYKDQDIFVNNGNTINRRELLLNFGVSF